MIDSNKLHRKKFYAKNKFFLSGYFEHTHQFKT